MVIGLTGSIACGKSLVSSYLKNKGYKIIDSDLISHDVLLLNEVKEKLVIIFSNEILDDNKEINRKVLGNIIFNNCEKKKKLQDTVLPYILNEINKQIKEGNGLIFLDAPLLIEYNLLYLVDKVIVVKVNLDIQINRLVTRDNITKEFALKKINSVLSSEEKEKYADFIIDNNYSVENTYTQIEIILKKLGEEYEI